MILSILLLSLNIYSFASESEEPAIPAERPVSTIMLWDILTDPTQGAIEQAIGFYSKGTLENASYMDSAGPGFVKLFAWRDRAWSTFDLSYIVQTAAQQMAVLHPQGERLQIGDIAQKNGGYATGHGSHQNGLDVDLAYFRTDHKEQDPAVSGFETNYVNKDGVLDPIFDISRNWDAFKIIHDLGRLERVFVDAVIKRALCEHAKTTGEFETRKELLRKLRPWPNHQDHFHVRISCPLSSPRCVPQAAPPEGDGCDSLN